MLSADILNKDETSLPIGEDYIDCNSQGLILSQTTNFGLFQTERVCR